jgi:ABC-type ATPase involved in cell division
VITASAVTKRYAEGREALRDVSFEITAGEMVFLTGHSGPGNRPCSACWRRSNARPRAAS